MNPFKKNNITISFDSIGSSPVINEVVDNTIEMNPTDSHNSYMIHLKKIIGLNKDPVHKFDRIFVLDLLNLYRTATENYKHREVDDYILKQENDDIFQFKQAAVFLTVFITVMFKFHSETYINERILVDVVYRLHVDVKDPRDESEIIERCNALNFIKFALNVIYSNSRSHSVVVSVVTPIQAEERKSKDGQKTSFLWRDIDDKVALKKVMFYREILNNENVRLITLDSNITNSIKELKTRDSFDDTSDDYKKFSVKRNEFSSKLDFTGEIPSIKIQVAGVTGDVREDTITINNNNEDNPIIIESTTHAAKSFYGRMTNEYNEVILSPCSYFECSTDHSMHSIVSIFLPHQSGVVHTISHTDRETQETHKIVDKFTFSPLISSSKSLLEEKGPITPLKKSILKQRAKKIEKQIKGEQKDAGADRGKKSKNFPNIDTPIKKNEIASKNFKLCRDVLDDPFEEQNFIPELTFQLRKYESLIENIRSDTMIKRPL